MELLRAQIAKNLPFAAYRQPGATSVTALLQKDTRLEPMTNFNKEGFVFAPFHPNKAAVMLRADNLYSMANPEPKIFEDMPYPDLLDASAPKQRYLQLIMKARECIAHGQFEKVVLSRKLEVTTTKGPIEAFRLLLQAYPDAFCYLWFHPDTGYWLGASPELLLRVAGDAFTTSSLAGTMKYRRGETPVWGAKEKKEQEMVTCYIRDALKSKVRSVCVSQPESVQAGALWHLRSHISGDLGQQTPEELVRALHPTPAVCGLPVKETLDFILKNEGYDRQFYTGYMGVIPGKSPGDQNTQPLAFYVNLRCMQLRDGVASVYVGGGITSESEPDREWEETCDKAGTMLRVLFNSPE